MSDAIAPSDLGIGLDDLVGTVERLQPDGDEIARLQTAVVLSERLGELGDHLVGHFVDEARRVGASWREIGDGLGVSKQAAQKRFVPTAGDVPQEGFLSRFTPRAREALSVARDTARRLGHDHVRTEDLVAGLVIDAHGLSAQAIAAQGVAADDVLAAVEATATSSEAALPEHLPFAAEAKKVLEAALREAFRRRHNYIGTEHLLLGVLADRRSTGARLLHDLGVNQRAASKWLDTTLADLAARKGGPATG
ncbi:MAG TPA: Clp protease N-terminal domain-containing protein [Acidimicrobiia bacterium]|nr:Clp protease N-terminal domain-containing protein [Acidimicrobiia bacterium]